jgi:fructose-specific component phosphotransferase system IIB-like protein
MVSIFLLAPLWVHAAEVAPPEWIACASDADCVVVKGACDPAAVNMNYAEAATKHFKLQKKKLTCPDAFWKPKAKEAASRCHLERCQIVAKEKAK